MKKCCVFLQAIRDQFWKTFPNIKINIYFNIPNAKSGVNIKIIREKVKRIKWNENIRQCYWNQPDVIILAWTKQNIKYQTLLRDHRRSLSQQKCAWTAKSTSSTVSDGTQPSVKSKPLQAPTDRTTHYLISIAPTHTAFGHRVFRLKKV